VVQDAQVDRVVAVVPDRVRAQRTRQDARLGLADVHPDVLAGLPLQAAQAVAGDGDQAEPACERLVALHLPAQENPVQYEVPHAVLPSFRPLTGFWPGLRTMCVCQ
jgi:hypothetical protein